MKLKVSHEYSGMIDYWGGNGRRWDNDAGCLFASYDGSTTLKDCVEQWCDEFEMGGDCDDFPADVDGDDLFEAIMECLTDQGRADYESGAIAECAAYFAAANGPPCCRECEEEVGSSHDANCSILAELEDGDDDTVLDEDCEPDEFDEFPQWVILVECTVCSECKKATDEHYVDDLCKDCSKKHYPGEFDENGEFIV